jgi:hypothetical protein
MRPSKTNAGLFICSYTFSHAIWRNSFHSVAITIASAFTHASSAEDLMLTCFLTAIRVSARVPQHRLERKRTLLKGNGRAGLGKVEPDLVLADLRVVQADVRPLRDEVTDERDRRGLASVAGVGLEREAKNCDALKSRSGRRDHGKEWMRHLSPCP